MQNDSTTTKGKTLIVYQQTCLVQIKCQLVQKYMATVPVTYIYIYINRLGV